MPTENDVRVFKILNAIEIDEGAAAAIEQMGNDAVSLVCEIASGAIPGLRKKVRGNAVTQLGKMQHPQARETIRLLINDDNDGIATRAMRAAGRRKWTEAVEEIATALNRPQLSPIRAAEAVMALKQMGSAAARQRLTEYGNSPAGRLPHRQSSVVLKALEQIG